MRQVRSTADDTGFRSPVHSYRRREPQPSEEGKGGARDPVRPERHGYGTPHWVYRDRPAENRPHELHPSGFQPRMLPLPFKLNQSGRHQIPRQKRKVTNWPAYDASLRQRGSLTVWFTDEAVEAWKAEPRTRFYQGSRHCL